MCAKGGPCRPCYSFVGASPRAIAVDDAAIFLKAWSGTTGQRTGTKGSHGMFLLAPPSLSPFYVSTSTISGAAYRTLSLRTGAARPGTTQLRPRSLSTWPLFAVPRSGITSPRRGPPSGTTSQTSTNCTCPAPAGYHHATKNKGYLLSMALCVGADAGRATVRSVYSAHARFTCLGLFCREQARTAQNLAAHTRAHPA